jgi:hypothetical protein
LTGADTLLSGWQPDGLIGDIFVVLSGVSAIASLL